MEQKVEKNKNKQVGGGKGSRGAREGRGGEKQVKGIKGFFFGLALEVERM